MQISDTSPVPGDQGKGFILEQVKINVHIVSWINLNDAKTKYKICTTHYLYATKVQVVCSDCLISRFFFLHQCVWEARTDNYDP